MVNANDKYNAQNVSKHREQILLTARKLFIQDGINAVSMSDIAKATEFSRNTLYRHFENKENLLFEVLKIIIRDIVNGVLKTDTGQEFESGYKELEVKLKLFLETLLVFRYEVVFMVEYDRYGSTYIDEYDHFLQDIDVLKGSIERGVKDGSINKELVNSDLSYVICEGCVSFVYRYILRKQSGGNIRIHSINLNQYINLIMHALKQPKRNDL